MVRKLSTPVLSKDDWLILDEKLHTHSKDVLPALLLYQDAAQRRKNAERERSTSIDQHREIEQVYFIALQKWIHA
jgi:hypothetical protein